MHLGMLKKAVSGIPCLRACDWSQLWRASGRSGFVQVEHGCSGPLGSQAWRVTTLHPPNNSDFLRCP